MGRYTALTMPIAFFLILFLLGTVIGSAASVPTVPSVLQTSNSTTTCNYLVNMTSDNFAVARFYNQSLFIRQNYITPSSAGISINNVTPEQLNFNTSINFTSGNSKYRILLYNLSYLPIEQSVKISLCSSAPMQQTRPYNFTSSFTGVLNVSKYKPYLLNSSDLGIGLAINYSSFVPTRLNFSISNYTAQRPLPSGLSKLGIVNVSYNKSANMTVRMTWSYSCSVPQKTVAPFLLKNGIWLKMENYTASSTGIACSVSFDVPQDPLVALFTNRSYAGVTTTTVSATTTIPSNSSLTTALTTALQPTTLQATTTIGSQASPYIPQNAIVAIAAAIAIIGIAYFIKKRRDADMFSFELISKPKPPLEGMPKFGSAIFEKLKAGKEQHESTPTPKPAPQPEPSPPAPADDPTPEPDAHGEPPKSDDKLSEPPQQPTY